MHLPVQSHALFERETLRTVSLCPAACVWVTHKPSSQHRAPSSLRQSPSHCPLSTQQEASPLRFPRPPQPELLGAAFSFSGMQCLAEVLGADSQSQFSKGLGATPALPLLLPAWPPQPLIPPEWLLLLCRHRPSAVQAPDLPLVTWKMYILIFNSRFSNVYFNIKFSNYQSREQENNFNSSYIRRSVAGGAPMAVI